MAFPPRLRDFNKVGKLFFTDNIIDVPVSSTKYILISTNTSKMNIENISIGGNVGLMTASIFATPTITSKGNVVVTHRYNRTILPTEDDSNTEIFIDAVVSDDGILLISNKTYGIADRREVLPVTVSGGGDFEMLVPKESQILIKLENTDPDNIANLKLAIQWIEENE